MKEPPYNLVNGADDADDGEEGPPSSKDVASVDDDSRSSSLRLTSPLFAKRWLSFQTIILLFACLLLSLPPLLIDLNTREASQTMEYFPLISAQEMRARIADDVPDAWFMPTDNGEPRVIKPPLVVWLHALVWMDLDPHDADPIELTLRARYIAVAMGLLTLIGVFQLGLLLGDKRTAVMATLIVASMFFFQRQARMASYDIHLVAWATLAIAFALDALAPFRPERRRGRRFWFDWIIAGFCFGCAWLSKGPISIPLIIGPVFFGIICVHAGRRRGLLGLIVMMLIAAAMAMPWYLAAWNLFPQSTEVWTSEYKAEREDSTPYWYYANIIPLAVPWSLWLVAGWLHPFMRAGGARRRQYLIGWLWFFSMFIMFTIAEAKQQRYLLPLVPAIGLLGAWVFRDHQQLREEDRPDPGEGRVRDPHWIMLLAGSLIVGPVLAFQDRIFNAESAQWMKETIGAIGMNWPAEPPLGPFTLDVALGLTAAMLLLVIVGWRRHARGRPVSGAIATALWGIVLTTAMWSGYSRGPSEAREFRHESEALRQLTEGATVPYLELQGDLPPDKRWRYYLRRITPAISLDGLKDRLNAGTNVQVLAQTDERHEKILTSLGLKPVFELVADEERPFTLWRTPDFR